MYRSWIIATGTVSERRFLPFALFPVSPELGTAVVLPGFKVSCLQKPSFDLGRGNFTSYILLSCLPTLSRRLLGEISKSVIATRQLLGGHIRHITLMASSVVDRKFLGKLAKEVEPENPLLSSILYKLLGLSHQLSDLLVKARKQRKLGADSADDSTQDLSNHILWLAREGLVMLEQYVLPMVANSGALKVLAYKLRASLYHVIVLFHNQPPVSARYMSTPEPASTRLDKGKGIATDDDFLEASPAMQQRSPYEGGPVAPPPGFGPKPPGAFLLPVGDYLPTAHRYFKDAVALADKHLWGSHSLRLSIKTEYSAFLYDCAHDEEASRRLARKTINEVYEATEGIDNDMFQDACELVTVLGRMMKRGQPPSTRSKASSPATALSGLQQQQQEGEEEEEEEEEAETGSLREHSPVEEVDTPTVGAQRPVSEAPSGFI